MCSLTGDSGCRLLEPFRQGSLGLPDIRLMQESTSAHLIEYTKPACLDPDDTGSEERALGQDPVATFQAFLVYPETLSTFFKCCMCLLHPRLPVLANSGTPMGQRPYDP